MATKNLARTVVEGISPEEQARVMAWARDWNLKGHLRRGYPKYFVAGQQATRRQYLKAAASDPLLPPFRKAENRPRRVFPPIIARHLGDRRRRAHG
jgi:hypothetical protein